jgi:hypothetical protein
MLVGKRKLGGRRQQVGCEEYNKIQITADSILPICFIDNVESIPPAQGYQSYRAPNSGKTEDLQSLHQYQRHEVR